MKIRAVFFLIFSFYMIPFFSYSVAYDPGDFLNSTKRSYSVVDDFTARWKKIDGSNIIQKMHSKTTDEDTFEKFFEDHAKKSDSDPEKLFFSDYFYELNRGRFVNYVDCSFTQETITNLTLKTQYGLINMDYKRRAVGFTVKLEDNSSQSIIPGIAISSNGAWQGFLKQDIELVGNNLILNGNPEDASFTDFYYNQVFDDLYVLSLYLRPYVYLHSGILINQEIDLIDGILGNGNDVMKKKSNRFFFQTSILGFLSQSVQYNKSSEKAEKIVSQISLTDLFSIFSNQFRRSELPDLNIGYQSVDFKPQELNTANFLSFPKQHTLFLDLDFYYYKLLYLKGKIETYLNHPNNLDSAYLIKQAYLETGLSASLLEFFSESNHSSSTENFYTQSAKFFYHYFFFGFSYLSDSRAVNFGHSSPSIYGFTIGFSTTIFWYIGGMNLEVRYANNYAPKIQNLIESVDHDYYSLTLSISF